MEAPDIKARFGVKSDIRRLIRAAAQSGRSDCCKGKRESSRVAEGLMLEADVISLR